MSAIYRLVVPKQDVGTASVVFFDLFNASGSAVDVILHSLVPIVSSAVAVTATAGIDIFLTRTTAIGTGGTAATKEDTDVTHMSFAALNHSNPLAATVTARLTPSGGGTAGAVLAWRSLFTDETTASQVSGHDLVQGFPIWVKPGTGIRVLAGSETSGIDGNVGFSALIETRPNA